MKTIEEAAEKASDREGFVDGAFFGAQWQQEQDNKELAMWKLAVERQEARCKALHGVISDLQDKNKYSEEEVIDLLKKAHFVEQNIEDWFEQFKKK